MIFQPKYSLGNLKFLVDFILYINFVQISCYNIFVEKLISSNIGKLEVRWIGSFDDSSPGPVITN